MVRNLPIGMTRRVMSLHEAYLQRHKLAIFDRPTDTANRLTFLENKPQGLKHGDETVYHVRVTDPSGRTHTAQRDGITRVYVTPDFGIKQ